MMALFYPHEVRAASIPSRSLRLLQGSALKTRTKLAKRSFNIENGWILWVIIIYYWL
jgi:hypothetical protein